MFFFFDYFFIRKKKTIFKTIIFQFQKTQNNHNMFLKTKSVSVIN